MPYKRKTNNAERTYSAEEVQALLNSIRPVENTEGTEGDYKFMVIYTFRGNNGGLKIGDELVAMDRPIENNEDFTEVKEILRRRTGHDGLMIINILPFPIHA